MSNLVDYAKDELKKIGMIDSGEPYNDCATKAILDLIELFASQGHSGFTAPYVVNVFSRLAMFKPLAPLTGEDSEWTDVGDGLLQNKRCFSVFKDKDGIAYNIEGKVFTDDGETWYTCKDSRVNVTFPYVVPDKPEHVYKNRAENRSTVYTLENTPGLRDKFADGVTTVFSSVNTFLDFIEDRSHYSSRYDAFLNYNDETYIINRETGKYINWYKGSHIGRDIHTNIEPDKIVEFLREFKEDNDGIHED